MAMVQKSNGNHDKLAVIRKGTNYFDKCRCGGLKQVKATSCRECRKKLLRSQDIQTQNLILKHLAIGMTLPQIARALHMQAPMVWNYWRRIMRRFGTRSPFKIALLAKQAGIV